MQSPTTDKVLQDCKNFFKVFCKKGFTSHNDKSIIGIVKNNNTN
nr:MAG TPA: Colipase [Caudoviricetes sp.]